MEHFAARREVMEEEDAPLQVSMRADKKISRNPSTDEKKVRRQIGRKQRKTALQEEQMTTTHREAMILEAMRTASSLSEQQALAAELQQVRLEARARVQGDRDTSLADAVIREAMAPVRTHELNTTATDWLDDVAEPEVAPEAVERDMLAEASLWFQRTSAEVKADREEFAEQAMGKAHVVASQYGTLADRARRAFLDHVAHLHSRTADDKPGKVDEDQSGNAESQITDYDTDGNDDETFDEKVNGELAPTGPVEVPSTRAPVIQENMDGKQSHLIARMARAHLAESAVVTDPFPDSEEGPQKTDQDDWDTQDTTGTSNAPQGTPGATSSLKVTAARPLHEIAREIRADWENVYFGAVPYLQALADLDSINDMYGQDPASHIVNYFLSNATSWRGETARRIKAELKSMVGRRGASVEAADNGNADSSLKDVEVGDEDDRPMWPWELREVPNGTDGTASDVADTHTPGQSEADYPQPKKRSARGDVAPFDARPVPSSAREVKIADRDEDPYYESDGSTASEMEDYWGDPDAGDYDPEHVREVEREVGERRRQEREHAASRVVRTDFDYDLSTVAIETAQCGRCGQNKLKGAQCQHCGAGGGPQDHKYRPQGAAEHSDKEKPSVLPWNRDSDSDGDNDLVEWLDEKRHQRSTAGVALGGPGYDDWGNGHHPETKCGICHKPVTEADWDSGNAVNDREWDTIHKSCQDSIGSKGSSLQPEAMHKGAPFAGYEDFAACVAANQDKDDPSAYCGKIKHQVEDSKEGALAADYKYVCAVCGTPDTKQSGTCPGCGHSGSKLPKGGSLRATAQWIDAARRVIQNHAYETVNGVLLDAFTASMLVQVYDALSPENQAKFDTMDLPKAVDVGWKLVKRTNAHILQPTHEDLSQAFRERVQHASQGSLRETTHQSAMEGVPQ